MASTAVTPISFNLNGKAVTVPDDVDPATSLVDYLRDRAGVKSVKVSCGEGGCGACAVEVVHCDPATGRQQTTSINSCLAHVASVAGSSLYTSEGLGSSKTKFHAVQEKIAEHNGSQCGFCTPGMVVACHTALAQAAATGTTLSEEQLERSLDGNLCRCTGYRPILDTVKSFADATDIEELARCAAGGCSALGKCGAGAPAALQEFCGGSAGAARRWIAPASSKELWSVLHKLRHAGGPYQIVAGCTGAGVYKNWAADREGTVVALARCADLRAISDTKAGMLIGGAVTISELIAQLDGNGARALRCSPDYWQDMVAHLARIAGHHVRNAASLGGHLALCCSRALESDVATLLIAANATVTLSDGHRKSRMEVEELLQEPPHGLGSGLLVTEILLPWPPVGGVLRSGRVAQRYYNSHAFVNAAAAMTVDGGVATDVRVVVACHCNLVHGGTKWRALRLNAAEHALNGAKLRLAALPHALRSAEKALRHVGAAEAVQQPASGLLLQALGQVVAQHERPPQSLLPLLDASSLGPPPPVRSSQRFPDYGADTAPVGKPVTKDRVLLQASGEARYTDDVPLAADALYAAHVLSAHACAEFSIDASAALQLPGVVSFLSAYDIPHGGANAAALATNPRLEPDPLFAEGSLAYCGQPLGLILATSRAAARRGAAAVAVRYRIKGRPLVTLDAAIAACSFYDESTYKRSCVSRGDPQAQLVAAPHAIRGARWYLPSQSHMYMETQSAVAQAEEGGALTVWSAAQSTDMVQQAVCGALGLRMNQVTALCRRAGGGFGGKANRSQPVAVAAALAAAATGRQVRLAVNRNDDLRMVGGRCETRVEYDVAFGGDGRVAGLAIRAYFQAGAWMDLAAQDMQIFAMGIDQVYSFPNFSLDCWVARTNLPPRTNMRAPGFFQASLVIEHIIEHVAMELGLDAAAVREINFMTKDAPGLATPAACAPPCGAGLPAVCSGFGGARDAASAAGDSAYEEDLGGCTAAMGSATRQQQAPCDAAAVPVPPLVHVAAPEARGAARDGLWRRVRRALGRLLAACKGGMQVQRGSDTLLRPSVGLDSEGKADSSPPPLLGSGKPCARAEAEDAQRVGAESEEGQYVTTTQGLRIAADNFTLPRIWQELKAASDYNARVADVADFNAKHKWLKRGIAMTACRYAMAPPAMPAAVSLYRDGSVVVAHGGAEIGQGLSTKVKQVAVYELSKVLPVKRRPLPLELVRLADNSTELLPNAGCTGGSTTSEASCQAVRLACAQLVDRLRPWAEQLDATGGLSWADLCAAVMPGSGSPSAALMSAYAYYDGQGVDGEGRSSGQALEYHSFGAAVSEVVVDALTGDRRVLRVDLLFDCGRSINPAVDIGQCEGAFVQGLGYVLQERVAANPDTGASLSDSTWEYKIPTAACIPREFNVQLLADSPNPTGIMSSKACGEPPLLLTTSVLAAMQNAVSAAAVDIHSDTVVTMRPEALAMHPPCGPYEVSAAIGRFSVAEVLQAAIDAL